MLHRDIKPSNVLMEGRTPILIDFGLARVADDPKLTHTGWLLGTPGYLAPEILYGENATTAADVHSWAATVAYAAIGGPPFGRGPSMAIMDRVRRGEHDLSAMSGPLRDVVAALPAPRAPRAAHARRGPGLAPAADDPAGAADGAAADRSRRRPVHGAAGRRRPVARRRRHPARDRPPQTLVMPGSEPPAPAAPRPSATTTRPRSLAAPPFPQRLDHPWEQQWEPAVPTGQAAARRAGAARRPGLLRRAAGRRRLRRRALGRRRRDRADGLAAAQRVARRQRRRRPAPAPRSQVVRRRPGHRPHAVAPRAVDPRHPDAGAVGGRAGGLGRADLLRGRGRATRSRCSPAAWCSPVRSGGGRAAAGSARRSTGWWSRSSRSGGLWVAGVVAAARPGRGAWGWSPPTQESGGGPTRASRSATSPSDRTLPGSTPGRGGVLTSGRCAERAPAGTLEP